MCHGHHERTDGTLDSEVESFGCYFVPPTSIASALKTSPNGTTFLPIPSDERNVNDAIPMQYSKSKLIIICEISTYAYLPCICRSNLISNFNCNQFTNRLNFLVLFSTAE